MNTLSNTPFANAVRTLSDALHQRSTAGYPPLARRTVPATLERIADALRDTNLVISIRNCTDIISTLERPSSLSPGKESSESLEQVADGLRYMCIDLSSVTPSDPKENITFQIAAALLTRKLDEKIRMLEEVIASLVALN